MVTNASTYEQLTWDKLFSAYFRKMTDSEADNWEIIIKHELNNVKNQELIDAVKFLRKKPLERNPNVDDIIRTIKQLRYNSRITNEPPQQQCEICNGSGWINYYEDQTTKAIFSGNNLYSYVIPCQCTNGKRILKKHYKPEHQNYIKQKSKQVFDFLVKNPNWEYDYLKNIVEANATRKQHQEEGNEQGQVQFNDDLPF